MKRKLERHIRHCEWMLHNKLVTLGYRKAKKYYFKKQIEVAQQKLSKLN